MCKKSLEHVKQKKQGNYQGQQRSDRKNSGATEEVPAGPGKDPSCVELKHVK